MTPAHWSILATAVLAVLGYLATYTINLLHARRKERLELVTRQLNDFYGPMFISTQVSAMAFAAYTQRLKTSPADAAQAHHAAGALALREWRLWVKEVLMPMNLVQEQIVLKGAHLIREPEVPDCLLQLSAHISAWKAVLKNWEDGDYSEQFSLIPYPQSVVDHVATAFRNLKAEQLRLMGACGAAKGPHRLAGGL